MISSGNSSFYKLENGARKYYDIKSKTYLSVPGSESFIILENYQTNIVWENSGASLIDIGDGIVNLEFHTKMNTIGGEVLEAVNKSVDIAEKDFHGLVIGNDAQNFSAGANLGLVLMLALEQEYDEIDFAVRAFQGANMRVKYAAVPVVVAPHGLALGGGCEISLHAAHVQASAETYIGMVEFGVGLIPGGGGTKEFVLRASDSYIEGEIETAVLRERYLTIFFFSSRRRHTKSSRRWTSFRRLQFARPRASSSSCRTSTACCARFRPSSARSCCSSQWSS